MTDEELEEIVNSERTSYTLMEPDYSKVQFTIRCMANEMAKRGMKAFWPIIKKGDEIMTTEEEQELYEDNLKLLDKISDYKHQGARLPSYIINVLGECYATIKNLHITNTEAIRENRSMSDHHRIHFAGLAMQSLLIMDRYEDVSTKAFSIADNMVKYSKTGTGMQ